MAFPDPDNNAPIGSPCPVIEEISPAGVVNYSDRFKGKYALILLFMRSCSYCHKALAYIKKFIEPEFPVDKLMIVGVGREHMKDELLDFAEQKKINFPLVEDPNRVIYSHFAEKTVPRIYLIGPDGKILYHDKGYDRIAFEKFSEFLKEKLA